MAQAFRAYDGRRDRQKECADRRRRDVGFQVGDEMLLSTRMLPVKVAIGGRQKLEPLYCGPFRILEKYTSAYHLELPQHM